MLNTLDIIEEINSFAPLELCPEWDNSGWQINLGNKTTKKIMLCLSVCPDIVEQAVKNDCDLIISHHPLLFSGIKSINASSILDKTIIEAIKNNIQIYSAHINLDKTTGGVADTFCNLLKLNQIQTFKDYVKLGNLETSICLDAFVKELKNILNIDKIRLINPSKVDKVKRVGICPGSGSDFIQKLSDIDVFITGDVKYHHALNVNNFAVIDAGHFSSEHIILPHLKQRLLSKFNAEIIIAEEKEPWIVI